MVDNTPDPKAVGATLLDQVEDVESLFLSARRRRADDLASAVQVFLGFVKGFESFDIEGPCVTVFGSARFAEGHPHYELARALGRALAEAGYIVMTGGGPGIMSRNAFARRSSHLPATRAFGGMAAIREQNYGKMTVKVSQIFKL